MIPKLTRRSFLEKGSKTLASAMLVPAFFTAATQDAFAVPNHGPGMPGASFDHFGVDETVIRSVLAKGLSRGASYCDLYFEHRVSNFIMLEDQSVNQAYGSVDLGVGIRVLKGDQTGFSFTEDLSPKAMKQAAATAAGIADTSKKTAPGPLYFQTSPNYYRIEPSWETVKIHEKIPVLTSLNQKVHSLDRRILKSSVTFRDASSHILMADSLGRVTCDHRPMAMIRVSCVARDKGKTEQNHAGLSGRNGMALFTENALDKLAKQVVRRTCDLFEAVPAAGGQMEVVLAPGHSGILLHEAIGHGLEADFNRKKTSVFSEKMGQKVARDFVTIVDGGTRPHARGSLNVDDEGNAVEETVLVENGRLESYLHDRISAAHYKVAPTGNGRRQSFRHPVMPRMRNTYMLPGPHKPGEIIQSVKKGLYAETFSNGQVLIGAGDFTFFVKSGALIENGRITRPIKDVNVIGNGPKVLEDIVMVADDLKFHHGGGTCGKNGQWVPVSMGLPTVKVSAMTVGGTQG